MLILPEVCQRTGGERSIPDDGAKAGRHCYNKALHDRLLSGDASQRRGHLWANWLISTGWSGLWNNVLAITGQPRHLVSGS
jgi:hypothetical protein